MLRKWNNSSISKKMVVIVSIIFILAVTQIYLIIYSLSILISVRTLIHGEGVWSKSQKNAVQLIYQYTFSKDDYFLKNFYQDIEIIKADKVARIELSKPYSEINFDLVRSNLLIGKIKESEIDGVIHLLTRYRKISYVQKALASWEYGDNHISDLVEIAEKIKKNINDKTKIKPLLGEIQKINSLLTISESLFSEYLIEGSRWLEKVISYILISMIIIFGYIIMHIVFKFGEHILSSLKDLSTVATQFGRGNFNVHAVVSGSDEFFDLSQSLNKAIYNLKSMDQIQKTNEIALRKINENNSLMVHSVKDYAVISLDETGQVLSWNSGAKSIFGYEENRILGECSSVFYKPDSQAKNIFLSELKKARSTGRSESEVICQTMSGSEFWANMSFNTAYSINNEVVGFTLIVKDISEKVKHKIELQKNNSELEAKVNFRTAEIQFRELQLRQITDALPVSVCQIDLDQRVIFVNESFCQLFGTAKEKILNQKLADILGKSLYSNFENNIPRVIAGQKINLDISFRHNKTNLIHLFSMVPDVNDIGEIVGLILVASDIKKYKEIESELKKAKENADIANETKSAFLANMSHEIRTPLGAVLGFSEIILNDEVSGMQKQNMIGAIKRNGQLLSNVINDILDLSKVEAGKLEIEKTNLFFDEIIKDIKSLLNLKATEKGIQLSVYADENVPAVIKTDPLRLRQILLNIIGNAIKFTRHGEVDVKISLITDSKQKNSKLAFVIKDTGAGMSLEQAQKIFAPFAQADISITRKYGGSGLGLILSKKLANALGGDVVLNKTEMLRGSTFTVTIDAGVPSTTNFKKFDLNQLPVPIDYQDEKFDFKNLRILLAEDSQDNQFIITHFLKASGADLKIVSNGQECVDLALTEKFDLILLDLQMPVMGGFDAISRLLKENYSKPIIALTAHAMKEDRKQCLLAGFKDHLSKPISRQSLLKSIQFWTEQKVS